jgi:hypothetical protein
MLARVSALAALVVLAAPGCVSEPTPVAPEGFLLAIDLVGFRSAVVDSVRLVFVPRVEGTTTPAFADIPPYDEGGVRMSVDVMGRLVVELSGDYVRANGVPTGEGDLSPRVPLELWTSDERMREGPQILGYAVVDGAQLGVAAGYFPVWPLPLGEGATMTIACTAGYELQCAPPP